MIRDPSDGSVREIPGDVKKRQKVSRLAPKKVNQHKALISTSSSGLAPAETDRATRLEKSREWLKNWKAERGNE